MLHFILGLIITTVGALMVLKAEWLLANFGRIGFFEQHLGTEGGSRLGYKIIGILAIFIGILFLTGQINNFLEWVLSPILRYSENL